ncbi:STAS domain-containing protein [Paractinoplanes rishiriensis]|uniref:STAS domain-containing protein n=1 Tax=Paractinoplanes rishiriensis TaxID=1050105 RepID=A0A919K5J9_9ACTN|nr:STAS domain-containing protein [Actinoplanes rishiriensis]GIF01251.1 hypothetical protein Ari01nite_87150 [Actinoplanes rishiriensis]
MSDRREVAAVVVVTESFDGVAVYRWERVISDAVAQRPQRLTVDLRDSPLIDATAIGVLLCAHRQMISDGGRMELCGPSARVRRILRLARLDHVFEIVEGQAVDTVQG